MAQSSGSCPSCGSTTFVDGKCERCGRPTVPDPDYHDVLETLASNVVSCAHDEYRDLRATAESGTELQRAIVGLANALRSYHYEGDGCVDH